MDPLAEAPFLALLFTAVRACRRILLPPLCAQRETPNVESGRTDSSLCQIHHVRLVD